MMKHILVAAVLVALPVVAQAQYCFTVGQCDEMQREHDQAQQGSSARYDDPYQRQSPAEDAAPQYVPYNSMTAPLMPGINSQGFSR